jgi:predicted short-subunit dehydrogenase-like oxidoreductase (DUF2520 family)
MRELDSKTTVDPDLATRCAVIGRGRLGPALAEALAEAGMEVDGPLGRGADPAGAGIVLLLGLEVLAGHEAFSLHPLMTVTAEGARFAGAGCAVAGATPRALRAAASLAHALGMRPVEIADEDRAAYHAAASIASNFLVTLEAAAERLAQGVGADRELLAPLVRATVENWAAHGAEQALTGPLVRGDEATVARQRAAIAERAPELLQLFDALADATRALARSAREEVPA